MGKPSIPLQCGVRSQLPQLPKFTKPVERSASHEFALRAVRGLGGPQYERLLSEQEMDWVTWHIARESAEILQGYEILGAWALAHLKES